MIIINSQSKFQTQRKRAELKIHKNPYPKKRYTKRQTISTQIETKILPTAMQNTDLTNDQENTKIRYSKQRMHQYYTIKLANLNEECHKRAKKMMKKLKIKSAHTNRNVMTPV